jgi:hypothetical protein
MIMAEHNGERMYFFMVTFYRGLGIRCQMSPPCGDTSALTGPDMGREGLESPGSMLIVKRVMSDPFFIEFLDLMI